MIGNHMRRPRRKSEMRRKTGFMQAKEIICENNRPVVYAL